MGVGKPNLRIEARNTARTERPMSGEKKRRIGQPRYSALLDHLAQHPDGRVRLWIAKFVANFRPPADAPRLLEALLRLEAALIDLAAKRPRICSMVEHELTGLRLTRAAASTVEAPVDGNLPTDAWLKKFATYGALLLVVDDDRPAFRALAAEYLRGVYTGVCTHANVANNIRLRSRSPDPHEKVKATSAQPWEGRFAATVQLLEDLYVEETQVQAVRFQLAACSSFVWRAKHARRYEHKGLVHGRTLTLGALADAFESLRLAIEAGLSLEVGIAAGFMSGLPWELSQRVPLAKPEVDDWVIWLDIRQGCFHLNLNPVVRGAASAKGNRRYVPASRAFRRFLPSNLAKALRAHLKVQRNAATLGALCGSLDIPPEHVIGEDDGRVLKTSIARFYNCRSLVSRILGIPAPLAAACMGDYGRLQHSRLFYYAASPKEVGESLKKLEPVLNWGSIRVEDNDGVVIGAAVVPELQTLVEIASKLAADVSAARPPRRYRLEHVHRLHNAFTDYSVFLVGLGVLSRDRKSLKVAGLREASVLGVGAMLDKRTRADARASPVALCKEVQIQATAYHKHCQCMLRRLALLGVTRGALVLWLRSVVNGTATDPFCRIDDDGEPRARGTRGVFKDLPTDLQIKADTARHFWDTTLSGRGVPDELVDAQARRLVSWASHWQRSRPICIDDLRQHVGTVQQQVLLELGIRAVQGFRK